MTCSCERCGRIRNVLGLAIRLPDGDATRDAAVEELSPLLAAHLVPLVRATQAEERARRAS